ncbi:MAG: DUF4126 domain-containing protein [Burkholderiaceae bacterium]|nr:DUF4126 domain-containing protein [Burkholderiaceae bacterium]
MDAAELIQYLPLAAALGFASGIRLYFALLVIGVAGALGWVALPSGLQVLANPWVIGAAAALTAMELVADKIPAVDTLWDAVHTFIRIPAGAALAAAAIGADSAAWSVLAALAGGSLAATSHFAKAGARAAVNTSPEPLSNIAVSTAEDVFSAALLWLALAYPWVAAAIVLLLLAFIAWLLPKLFRFVWRAFLQRDSSASAH